MRAPVVKHIYDLYLSGGVGITQIRNALNADPDCYPPPIPVDPARSLGAWSRSSTLNLWRLPVLGAARSMDRGFGLVHRRPSRFV